MSKNYLLQMEGHLQNYPVYLITFLHISKSKHLCYQRKGTMKLFNEITAQQHNISTKIAITDNSITTRANNFHNKTRTSDDNLM